MFVVSPLYHHHLLHPTGSLQPMTVSFPSPKYSSSLTSFSPHTIHLHFTPSHYISSTLIYQTPYSSILTPHNFLSLHQTPASSASHHSSSKLKPYSLPGSLQHNLLPSHQTHSLLGWTTHECFRTTQTASYVLRFYIMNVANFIQQNTVVIGWKTNSIKQLHY